ncbi:MAG: ribonuclease P protein component [Chitinophagales bacterium]|nr:MAG: ribonuclease P protein component [Chitinophagales bacterium]
MLQGAHFSVRNTFSRHERLKSRKLLARLFAEGHSLQTRTLRVVWLPLHEDLPALAQVAFGVSKKNIKKAVERNRTKRLMREAYRLRKAVFYKSLDEKNVRVILLLIYTGRDVPAFEEVFKQTGILLQRILDSLPRQ